MARKALWIYLATILFFSSFCILFSTPCSAAKDATASLRKRAVRYWDHRIAKEFEKAFTYEDPASVKELSLNDYFQGFGTGVRWLGAEIGEIKVDGDKARVQVKIRYLWTFTPNNPKEGIVSYVWEDWKKVDGTWYHVYKGMLKPTAPQPAEGKETGKKQ